ncbi:hypothetical protein AgCh_035071 [Apium graveolens]
MDYQAPPAAALKNLTPTDSLRPPPTATNSETTVQNNVNVSREESLQRVLLLTSIRQIYGILMAFPKATLDERELSMHVREKSASREFYNSVRLQSLRRRIIGKLSNMAEDEPEHMESLELAKSYVLQGTNREDVLRIVKSVWRQ